MTCLTELDLMRYCDGELDDVERRDAALHLASCERCGTMVATIRAENATLRAVLLAPWSPPAISAAHIGLRMALTVLAVLIVRWTVGGFDDPSLFSTVPLAITGVVTVLQFVSYPVAFVLAVLLVAATAGLAMRRRPVALMALLLVLIQAQPFAMVRRTGSSAIVAADEVIDDSLFAGADLVRIDGRVNGDVFAMGDRVEVGGVITGRLIAFAQTVSISGSAGSIYGFGRRITVNGAVGEWGAWGEEVRLGPDARVSGASTTMGDSIFLEGSVSAPITTLGHKLTVGPLARIEQRLHARVNRADISPGAFIADATDLRIGSAARLDDWSAEGDGSSGRLRAAEGEVAIDLTVSAAKPA